ncbi:MAG TPA: DUF4331 domain-containing protein [Roseiflexaceae bacterium]|jgi:hypothetical protein|nr:DUF4331 domain-containing protein [Roseiflexaceae bacterium]
MSSSRRIFRQLSLVLTPLFLITSMAIMFSGGQVGASSHREAPLISKDPAADNTDVYAFVSPDAPNTVTLVANWIPFEEPGGGPNFYHFDDNALYNIKIDTNGDAIPDITYEWRFKTQIKKGDTFLYNTGPITAPDSGTFNYTQHYTVTEFMGDNTDSSGARASNGSVLFANELMPPDNIGPRSTPNYEALAANFINIGTGDAAGYKEFTGQREDPFYVDVNSIFDLGGLRPFNGLHLIPLSASPGLDSTAGYNVHATIIQVPISELAPNCPANDPGVGGSPNCAIGVWSTADRPRITTRVGLSTLTNPGGEEGSGGYVQVSRLGMPLTNEVVIPLALKDAFNALKPELDQKLFTGAAPFTPEIGALVQRSILRPELQSLYKVLYPSAFNDSNLPQGDRNDLFTIFLTGIPGVNQQAQSGDPRANPSKIASEQLRLNVAIKPTAGVCQGKRLGALDGDFAGFPNGRRLEDDVIDISLRAVAGGYGPVLSAAPPAGLGLPNFTPGNLLGDGVDKDDRPCLSSFPYVGTPHPGYDRIHANIWTSLFPLISNGKPS